MRRSALGIVAALLLFLGGVSAFGGPGGESAQQFAGVCIKSGLVLGALWLALPQITALLARAPRWFFGWFGGKRKDSNVGTPASGPAPRQPRPRRRSGR